MKIKKKHPPHIAGWIISKVSLYEEYASLTANIEEEYLKLLSRRGRFLSWIWYWYQTFHVLRQYFYSGSKSRIIMFKKNMKVTFRNIIKNKTYSFINILGLSCGIICFLFILIFVIDEISYDRHHNKPGKIYRLAHEIKGSQGITGSALSTEAWGPAFKNQFKEIEFYVRIKISDTKTYFRHDNKSISVEKYAFAGKDYYNIFSVPLLFGNPNEILSEPYSVVITDHMAQLFFGTKNPLGRTLFYEGSRPLKITGIMKTDPHNSHLDLDVIISLITMEKIKNRPLNDWFEFEYYTYLLLRENTSRKAAELKFTEYNNTIAGKMLSARGVSLRLFLQPVQDIHLKSNLEFEIGSNGNILYVYLLSISAVFLLFIASFNFINLSVARSIKKSKEIGVRKVLGANRTHVLLQFMGESFTVILISLFIALTFVSLFLPWFNNLTGKQITMAVFLDLRLLLLTISLPSLIGLISGSYPALVFFSLPASNMVSGGILFGKRKKNIKNLLIVLQFSLAIVLLSGTNLIFRQYKFMKSKNPGFNEDQVLVIPMTNSKMMAKAGILKQELGQISGISGIGFAGSVPGGKTDDKKLVKELSQKNAGTHVFQRMKIGYDLVSTLGMEIMAGRNFSREFKNDRKSFLLNETGMKKLGFGTPEEAIDKIIQVGGSRIGNVIGIVKDFHIESMHQNIEPMVFYMDLPKFIFLKISAATMGQTLDALKEKFEVILQDVPFEYFFLDEKIDSQYKSEESLGKVFRYFSIIALLTSCLGLYGLLMYSIEQRKKEIEIRKVLGASVKSIFKLLSFEYMKLILTSILIALPLTYIAVDYWLKKFAYRIDISGIPFLVAILISLVTVSITLAIQSIGIALTNPIDSLRHE
jgi:putative ABC transport system permease protein